MAEAYERRDEEDAERLGERLSRFPLCKKLRKNSCFILTSLALF